MQYYSHYIWESGSEEKNNPVSVALQQVSRKTQHYLLACICDGEMVSGYFTERLVEWFHGQFLQQTAKRACSDKDICKSLEKELARIQGELAEFCMLKNQENSYQVWGILLWNDRAWLFQKGNAKGYLFNRRFNRRQRKGLHISPKISREIIGEASKESALTEPLRLVPGRIQRKIGILLCTSEFGCSITEEEMIQVLFEDFLDDKKIRKRLEEIRRADVDREHGSAAGAIYIRVE